MLAIFQLVDYIHICTVASIKFFVVFKNERKAFLYQCPCRNLSYLNLNLQFTVSTYFALFICEKLSVCFLAF